VEAVWLCMLMYVLLGIMVGSLSGLLGIGGGLLVVPGLAWIYSMEGFPQATIMHMAAGTSLAIMIITTSASLYAHIKRGAKVWPVFSKLLPGVIVGTICGVLLADVMHTDVLRLAFGVFVLWVAITMLIARAPKPQHRLPGSFGMLGIALLIGGKSGLLGVGGGALTIPFLARSNVLMRNAVAISVACGLVVAIVGSLSVMLTGSNEANMPAYSSGYIYWPAFLGVASMSPIFAQLGAKLSGKLPVKLLKRIFGVFMLFIAIRMLLF